MSVTALIQTQGEETNLKLHTAVKAAIQGHRIRSPTKPQNVARRQRVGVSAAFLLPRSRRGMDKGKEKEMTIKAMAMAVILAAMSVTACDLVTAIGWVESRNNDQAVGDAGKAVGRYQIHMAVIQDVNAKCGTAYTAEDRKDPAKAREIMEKYIAIWATHYERTQGKPATDEIKARIWNGGPRGWRKQATKAYWEKVQKAIKQRQ